MVIRYYYIFTYQYIEICQLLADFFEIDSGYFMVVLQLTAVL